MADVTHYDCTHRPALAPGVLFTGEFVGTGAKRVTFYFLFGSTHKHSVK
jgi:hypothetical protein